MYLQGTIGLTLDGGTTVIERPSGIGGGIGNLLRHGNWQTQETQEGLAHVALVEACHAAVAAIGPTTTLRIQCGDATVFEGSADPADAFTSAVGALESQIDQGLMREPHRTLEAVYSMEDAQLRYAIHVLYNSLHAVGEHAIIVDVVGSPTALRRRDGESDDQFVERITTVDRPLSTSEYQACLNDFVDRLVGEVSRRVPGVRAQTACRIRVIRTPDDMGAMSSYGSPLYGFDPYYDLSYMMLMGSIQQQMMMDAMWASSPGGWFQDYSNPGFGMDSAPQDLGSADSSWSDVGGIGGGIDAGMDSGGFDGGGGFDSGGSDGGSW